MLNCDRYFCQLECCIINANIKSWNWSVNLNVELRTSELEFWRRYNATDSKSFLVIVQAKCAIVLWILIFHKDNPGKIAHFWGTLKPMGLVFTAFLNNILSILEIFNGNLKYERKMSIRKYIFGKKILLVCKGTLFLLPLTCLLKG